MTNGVIANDRMSRFFALFLTGLALVWLATGGTEAQDVDAHADRILRDMGEYLKTAEEFSFEVELSYDAVRADGQKILLGAASQVWIRRPDRMRTAYDGDERKTRVYFNARTITIHNLVENVYAVTEVPPNIDEALDLVFERYGFSVPVADFFASPAISVDPLEGETATV